MLIASIETKIVSNYFGIYKVRCMNPQGNAIMEGKIQCDNWPTNEYVQRLIDSEHHSLSFLPIETPVRICGLDNLLYETQVLTNSKAPRNWQQTVIIDDEEIYVTPARGELALHFDFVCVLKVVEADEIDFASDLTEY